MQGFVIIGPPLHYWYLLLSRVNVYKALQVAMSEEASLSSKIPQKPDSTVC